MDEVYKANQQWQALEKVKGKSPSGKAKLDASDPTSYTYYNSYMVEFYFTWQLLIFIINNYYVIDCILVPTFQAYYNLTMTKLLAMNIIFMILYAIDLMLKVCLTPRLGQKRNMISNKGRSNSRRLLKHYLFHDWLITDLMVYVIFVISFMVPYSAAQFMRLIIALKILEIVDFNDKIYQRFHIYRWVRQLYTIIKMMYVILLFSHYFGCFFYILDTTLMANQTFGDPIESPSSTWLIKSAYYQMVSLCYTPIYSLSDVQRYIYANYFITALITTIAYGDIVGKNYIEDAFVMVLLILSTISIALILEQFMIMMQNSRFALFQIIKQYNCVKEFMTQKNVPLDIQNQVRSYLFYVQYQKNFFSHQPILGKLSEKLQKQILFGAYSKPIRELFEGVGAKDLVQICSLINQTAFQAETEIYNPYFKREQRSLHPSKSEEEISLNLESFEKFEEEELINADFIYITEGQVTQYIKSKSDDSENRKTMKEFIIPSQRKHLNFYQFITKQRVRYGLRTKSLVKCIKIQQSSFEEYLAKNPSILKIVKESREQILCCEVNRNYSDDICALCDGIDHNLEKCPEAHYCIDQYSQNNRKITELFDQKQKNTNNLPNFPVTTQRFKRKNIQSKKAINVLHFSVLFRRLQEFSQRQKYKQIQDDQNNKRQKVIMDSYMHALTRNLLKISQIKSSESKEQLFVDSHYDPNGVNEKYSL